MPYATQTQIARLYELSSIGLGVELSKLGLKKMSGNPSETAIKRKIAVHRKDQRMFFWDIQKTIDALAANGVHPKHQIPEDYNLSRFFRFLEWKELIAKSQINKQLKFETESSIARAIALEWIDLCGNIARAERLPPRNPALSEKLQKERSELLAIARKLKVVDRSNRILKRNSFGTLLPSDSESRKIPRDNQDSPPKN